MEKIENIKQQLRKFKKTIKEKYRAEIIGIFGSYARAEETKDSDVDIIVEFDKGATLFDFVELNDFLEKKLQLKVDLVTKNGIKKEIKDIILKEVIYI
jgi:predicted nucleotidyltransferase